MDFSKLKLVIWDLDDTFWNGTLSEGGIDEITQNIQLVKDLTDCGVVNTICSKNDLEPVMDKLKELGIYEYFVFLSVNWEPKGKRIQALLIDMGLRAVNCLFIDDNIVNLNEAKYYEPKLNIAEPNIITELTYYFSNIPKTDLNHKRLSNYKVLETKRKAQAKSANNVEFLYESGTQVELHSDCEKEIDRIEELVLRTNQLNFTKKRDDKATILSLIQDEQVRTGYVTVRDKFGDYGIVGFYALKRNECIHFLFSCRTIGQGVEQYVYAKMGYPKLEVVGEVINLVNMDPAPAWINRNPISNQNIINSNAKLIFKGACDLQIVCSYLKSDNIIEEFTYVAENNKWIEHHNNSVNYLYLPFLTEEQQRELLNDCIFNDSKMFKTAMYDEDVSIVFLSTMVEPNLGIYKNKKSGICIAFGEGIYPLTDSNNWNDYINNRIFTAENDFTKEWLTDFSSKYDFIGSLTPEQILENAKITLSRIDASAKLCFFLGSETPYLKNKQKAYNDRHIVYKKINQLFREWAMSEKRVLLVDFNDYIKGQEDFTNNINHFVRRVYYEAAKTINNYIEQEFGVKAKQSSYWSMRYWSFVDKLGATGFYQTRIYSILRKPFAWIKNILTRSK